jgi:DNA-directed RNA polymerase sigma subunit (sigma70/sigma32)
MRKLSILQEKTLQIKRRLFTLTRRSILSHTELDIVTLRTDENPKTLEQIAKMYKMTREKVRCIEAKAFEKLRQIQEGLSKQDGYKEVGPNMYVKVPVVK